MRTILHGQFLLVNFSILQQAWADLAAVSGSPGGSFRFDTMNINQKALF
jgi:hypothetical protein